MKLALIKRLSNTIGEKLADNLNQDIEDAEIYSYALQMLIGGIIKAIIFLATAYTFNLFLELMIFLAVFGGLRLFAGGYHSEHFVVCLVISLGLFVVAGKVPILLPGDQFWIFILLFFGFLIFMYLNNKYVPVTVNYKLINKKNRCLFTYILTSFWLIGTTYLIQYNHLLAWTSMISAAGVYFFLTPSAHSFIYKIDKIL